MSYFFPKTWFKILFGVFIIALGGVLGGAALGNCSSAIIQIQTPSTAPGGSLPFNNSSQAVTKVELYATCQNPNNKDVQRLTESFSLKGKGQKSKFTCKSGFSAISHDNLKILTKADPSSLAAKNYTLTPPIFQTLQSTCPGDGQNPCIESIKQNANKATEITVRVYHWVPPNK